MRESDLPNTDMESMNRDHRDQVEMVNGVLEALQAFDGSEAKTQAVDEALEDFAEHTQEHFRQEDDQMHRYEFPAFEEHKAEHDRTLARVREIQDAWRASREVAPLKIYMEEEFPRWLVMHVSSMDVFSAQYVMGNAH